MRVPLVEDEDKVSQLITRGLRGEGYSVDTASDGKAGLELALSFRYDLVILDIMLPQITGTEILSRIREQRPELPVLMLSARDLVRDKVAHFQHGADDYLTKPFSFEELQARVRALLRRRERDFADRIKVGSLELDRLSRQVRRDGKRIALSAKEYSLLEYLAVNAGRTLSRTMIIEHVWDQSFEGLTNIVDVYVRQLRRKIDDGHARKLIHTVRGLGYRLGETDA